MDAKELTVSAALVKVLDISGKFTDEVFRKSVVMLAEHVLATVRDDDDDPVTESEIDSATGSYNRLSVTKTTVTHYDKPAGKRLCVAISEDDGNLVLVEGCKTMAQFRALLFGLGIPRKEST